ncbi:MAG: hypothetical protein ACT4QE_24190 [Anaerolineales bacterium]
MADISAIFGILLFLGLTFPGLLTALWLIFPATVERARIRLDRSPWQCFWLGGVLLAFVTIPATLLIAVGLGPTQFAGWSLIALTLMFSSLGAAGLAAKMGQHLALHNISLSSAGAFVRGAVALELAAAFPVAGWLIVVPLVVVLSLGATAFAVMKWMPRPHQPTVNSEPLAVASRQ